MSAVVLGANDTTLTRKFRRHTRLGGTSKVAEYKGPIAKCETLFEAIVADINLGNSTYDDVEYDEGGGFGLLRVITNEVGDPVSEDDSAVWEVDSQEMFIDIRRHVYFSSMTDAYDHIRKCDGFVSDPDKGPYVADDEAADFDSRMGRYYALRMAGVEGRFFSLPVVRKTIAVSARTTIEASWDNVNLVVPLQGDGGVNPPNKIIGQLNKLPTESVPVASDGDTSIITCATGSWEWLKKAPRTIGRARGKEYEIVYEWWGAEKWSKVFYNGSWDPSQD